MRKRFWEQATQLLSSGESAVLATVMAIYRQVPKVSLPGAHLIVTAAEILASLEGEAVDCVVVPHLRTVLSPDAFLQQVAIPADAAHEHGMLHGGSVELLVQPLSDFSHPAMHTNVVGTTNPAHLQLRDPTRHP